MPLRIEADVEEPATAWRTHRKRVRAWLDALPDAEWTGATRCDAWDVLALTRHLASGSQFLGYTLHRAASGVPTTLLRGFDPHATVNAAAATLGELTPQEARDLLGVMDAAVEQETAPLADGAWSALAESPPGNVPAHLAVNHFLFDSWVHEYDLMLPRGEAPFLEPVETTAVVRYLVGLAALVTGAEADLDLRLSSPEIRLCVRASGRGVHVADGSGPPGSAVIEADAIDLVDRATGRASAAIHGDDRALSVIDGFGALLRG